jgi:hypothetical protein
MNPRLYKTILALAAIGLLTGAGLVQGHLNRERLKLGLTPLPNDPSMPPMLALTTQALGGFRGLIANALWIRANDLQLEDKYFEMVQLSRWITLLEPHFAQVWAVQAWNMAYNISVKFSDAADRWRWVRHGIELLRDQGLRYNPDAALIYRELAWFYQHKMGMNLDDAHFFYKAAWAGEIMPLLTEKPDRKFNGHPDFDQLLNPTTPEAARRAATLREVYKLDPAVMKAVDDRYGPLDWRLPEAHALYWAWLGLDKSAGEDLITLRRVIYQSMQLAFTRGRLRIGPAGDIYLEPNLDMIASADRAYEDMANATDVAPHLRDAIRRAHRNFLQAAVYELYIHNRLADGERWMRTLRQKYPDALPADVTLADYAIRRAMEEVQTGAQARMTSIIEALVTQSYLRLADGEDDEAAATMQRAQEMFDGFQRRNPGNERLRLTPMPEVKKQVVEMLLDERSGLAPEARAILRTKLNLPTPPPPSTPERSSNP